MTACHSRRATVWVLVIVAALWRLAMTQDEAPSASSTTSPTSSGDMATSEASDIDAGQNAVDDLLKQFQQEPPKKPKEESAATVGSATQPRNWSPQPTSSPPIARVAIAQRVQEGAMEAAPAQKWHEPARQLPILTDRIEQGIKDSSNRAAGVVLSGLSAPTRQREESPTPVQGDTPPPPKRLTYGRSSTYELLDRYIEPTVTAAAATGRQSPPPPADLERRAFARLTLGGGTTAPPAVAPPPAAVAESASRQAGAAFEGRRDRPDQGSVGAVTAFFDAQPKDSTVRQVDRGFFSGRFSQQAVAGADEARSPSQPPAPHPPATQGEAAVWTPTVGQPPSTSSPPSQAQPRELKTELSDLKVPPPPPPKVSAIIEGNEGGVRMSFDAAAIRAAGVSPAVLAAMEQSLVSARTDEELARALTQANERLASALTHELRLESSDVVAVSLGQLLTAADAFRARWHELPADLRHPGPLRRIFGFVVRPDADDVLLLGSSQGNAPPLDLDDLILGLRLSWRDGTTPGCSLDPDVQNPGGEQRVRLMGVPPDSRFAQIMLDADYVMKRVVFGDRQVDVPGFVNIKSRLTELLGETTDGPHSDPSMLARFWFTPAPPLAGEVQVSPDGQVAVWNSRVRLEAENMVAQGGTLCGTGTEHPLVREVARSFTANMRRFEQAVPELAQLHQLFDIVLAGTVLRERQLRLPALERFVELPTQPVKTRESYPGLTVFVETAGIKVAFIQGGVTAHVAIPPEAYATRDDLAPTNLLDSNAAVGVMPRLRQNRLFLCGRKDDAIGRQPPPLVSRQLAQGHFSEAARALTARLAARPSDGELYLQRARAYIGWKLYWLADRDLRAAEALGADPNVAAARRLQLRCERGDVSRDVAPLAAEDRRRLGAAYVHESQEAAAAGAMSRALTQIEQALAFEPTAYASRALRVRFLAATGRQSEARAELETLLVTHATDAQLWLLQAALEMQRGDEGLAPALAAVNKALQLNAKLLDAHLLRAQLRLGLDSLDTTAAHRDVRAARAIDPTHVGVLVAHARLCLLDGDTDGALGSCNRAIRAAPGYAPAYGQRIRVRLAQNRTSEFDPKILEDCNATLLLRPVEWDMRTVRAEQLCSLSASLNHQELSPERLQKLLSPIVLEHMEHLGLLNQLEASAATLPAEEVQRLFRQGLLEAAVCDFVQAAKDAPAPHAERIQRLASLLKDRISPHHSP